MQLQKANVHVKSVIKIKRMKKYHIHNNGIESGPFTFEELKTKNIQSTTSVWFEGLANWIEAGKVEELKDLFQSSTPPPFEGQKKTPPPINEKIDTESHKTKETMFDSPVKKKSMLGKTVGIIILFAALGIGILMVINNPESIPGVKIEINTPKPTVVTSRADGKKSGLFNARTTVYATIMNQGGNGNVLVTFHIYQGGKDFEKSKSFYLGSNDKKDIEMTFEEVDYVSGEITYKVEALAK